MKELAGFLHFTPHPQGALCAWNVYCLTGHGKVNGRKFWQKNELITFLDMVKGGKRSIEALRGGRRIDGYESKLKIYLFPKYLSFLHENKD